MTEHSSERETWIVALDEEAGPAQPIPAERAQAMARAAVRTATRRRVVLGRPTFWMIAAAAIMVGGGAMAAVGAWVMADVEPATLPESDAKPTPPAVRTRSRAIRLKTSAVPASTERAGGLAGGGEGLNENQSVVPPRPPPPATAEPDGDTLLVRANQARASGKFPRAMRLYRRAASSHDVGVVAVALVAEAALTLDHSHRPKRALRIYKRALARSRKRALSAVARHGIAQCYRALGKVEMERDALREFLRLYPEHWLASKAATRMGALKTF